MKILVTGAKGFIGKNLVAELKNQGYDQIMEFDIDTEEEKLLKYCASAEFVFHLAGVNRPQKEEEFMLGNFGFSSKLLNNLQKHNNKCPIIISSSTQAALTNPYGKSKKEGEDLLLKYSKESGAKVFVYRLPNVFGKWCRPNYNSAVATFCYNMANGLPIVINDRNTQMTLTYVDDVVAEFIKALNIKEYVQDKIYQVPKEYKISLGEIADLIENFAKNQQELSIPNMADEFTKKLYSTYVSYLPKEKIKYPLKMNVDERGSFTEFIKTIDRGQVSVNISKPGIAKGNHWHHSKNEKFLVVSGKGVIRLRKIDQDEICEFCVSGEKLEVVEIPVGYTHNIENIGENDMVTIMWVNEPFNKEKPDTYYLEV